MPISLSGLHLVSRLLQAGRDQRVSHEVLLLPQGEGMRRQVQKQKGSKSYWGWSDLMLVILRNASGAGSKLAWRLGWRSSGCSMTRRDSDSSRVGENGRWACEYFLNFSIISMLPWGHKVCHLHQCKCYKVKDVPAVTCPWQSMLHQKNEELPTKIK